MIKESKGIQKELVASTVRIPKELNLFIEELAVNLVLSKQEVMLKLFEEGIKVAKEEIDLKESEEYENSNFHILNTNRRNNVNDHDDMVNNGIAAAYYDPWKRNIDRIKKDDIVFLYANGVGIVAYGKGSGKTLKKDSNGDKDACHYQELCDFFGLEKPISATEIKKILGRNVIFLKTMSAMPDGQKILDKINEQQIV